MRVESRGSRGDVGGVRVEGCHLLVKPNAVGAQRVTCLGQVDGGMGAV